MTALDDYDRLEATMKAALIPSELWEAIGDVWINNPPRAFGLVERFKATARKQHDALDQALQSVRTAYDQQDGPGLQVALKALIAVCSPQQPMTRPATLGDGEKPLTKQARSLDALLGSVSDHLKRTGGNSL